MISPHPTTTQMVAEAARLERLERLRRLAVSHGPIRRSLLGRYAGQLTALIGRALA